MVLLASYVKGKAPLPIYQVDNLEQITHRLKASYENIRPEVDGKFAGQIDS